MVNNNAKCRASNPATCKYHSVPIVSSVEQAIKDNDYVSYEKLREENFGSEVSFVHDDKFRNVKKMPALFVIDRVAHKATTDVNPVVDWVFSEQSVATIKRDGTSVTVDDEGVVWARRSVKKGKTPPPGYVEAEVDSYTGHSFGLEPIEQSGFYKMFKEAHTGGVLEPGTYELCGPKINGNPENLTGPHLFSHGEDVAVDVPDLTGVSQEDAYTVLRNVFAKYKEQGIEGVVWWGSDNKRVKLRVKDFFGDPNRF